MKFIRISNTVVINPERIDAIELHSVTDRNHKLIFHINGKTHTASRSVTEIFDLLAKAGIDLSEKFSPDLTKQFTAV